MNKRLALLIRKQDLAVARKRRLLHALRERRANTTDALDRSRARQAATRAYLDQLLTGGGALALETLRLTRINLIAGLERIGSLETELAGIDADLETAVQDAANAWKQLDKLRELAAQRHEQDRDRERRQGWQTLDEWVLNTRGRSA